MHAALISAIIPVYNNAATVGRVVASAQAHPGVSEVIVVCDASRDGSKELLDGIPGIKLINHFWRQGKGGAVVAGWNAATHDIILGLDADLAGITPGHVGTLIRTFESGRWDMVIGATHPRSVFSPVNGNRIYRRHVVLPFQTMAKDVGYGIEQVINFAHREKRVHTVYLADMQHELKYHRHPPQTAAWLYAKEGWELARTEYRLGFPVTRGSLASARGIIAAFLTISR